MMYWWVSACKRGFRTIFLNYTFQAYAERDDTLLVGTENDTAALENSLAVS